MRERILSEIFEGIWLLRRQTADSYLPAIISLVEGKIDLDNESYHEERLKSRSLRFASFNSGVYKVSEYGQNASPEDAPEESISVINITDVVMKYDMWCGPAGMLTKSDLITRADNNPNVIAHLLNIDSGGGEGYAARGFIETISKLQKPVFAFIDDLAASAAYFIASAAKGGIYANSELAEVGSIGTFIQVADYTDFFKNKGIKLFEIYADASSDKNKPYYEAIRGNNDLIKPYVNRFNDMFLASVEKNRDGKLTSGRDVWGTGKLFFASEALEIGLIDGYLSFDETVKTIYETIKK